MQPERSIEHLSGCGTYACSAPSLPYSPALPSGLVDFERIAVMKPISNRRRPGRMLNRRRPRRVTSAQKAPTWNSERFNSDLEVSSDLVAAGGWWSIMMLHRLLHVAW